MDCSRLQVTLHFVSPFSVLWTSGTETVANIRVYFVAVTMKSHAPFLYKVRRMPSSKMESSSLRRRQYTIMPSHLTGSDIRKTIIDGGWGYHSVSPPNSGIGTAIEYQLSRRQAVSKVVDASHELIPTGVLGASSLLLRLIRAVCARLDFGLFLMNSSL